MKGKCLDPLSCREHTGIGSLKSGFDYLCLDVSFGISQVLQFTSISSSEASPFPPCFSCRLLLIVMRGEDLGLSWRRCCRVFVRIHKIPFQVVVWVKPVNVFVVPFGVRLSFILLLCTP
jgi:hypothetical protein